MPHRDYLHRRLILRPALVIATATVIALGGTATSAGADKHNGWYNAHTPLAQPSTNAVVVTTREGKGRWHDARLLKCRNFAADSTFRHQIIAVGSAAFVTLQCEGDRRTYFDGLG